MENKYELTDETIEYDGRILHRIKALRNISPCVRKGDIGGFIENYSNLSQFDNCWIFNNAKVYDNAKVYRNAEIRDNACIYDYCMIYDNAEIYDNVCIYGTAEIYGHTIIKDNVKVYGTAKIRGETEITKNSEIYGFVDIKNSTITDNTKIYGKATINRCNIFDNSEVYNISILNNVIVFGESKICCNNYTDMYINDAILFNDAYITSSKDIIVVIGLGSIGRKTTFFKCKDGIIKVNCGCFNGTIDEFKEEVTKTYKDNLYEKEYLMLINLVKFRFANLE